MKQFDRLNYYEMLDIPVTSTIFEIRNAYQNALSIYDEDSLATYSFFTEDERKEILKKIDKAFYTLIDEDRKATYDFHLKKETGIDVEAIQAKKKKKPVAMFDSSQSINVDLFFEKVKNRIDMDDIKDMANMMLTKDAISGTDIKELRESIGIELEEIFEIERISVSILNAIEKDLVEDLPSPVYLKNFLKSYANVLHIDGKVLVDGYMKNIHQIRENKNNKDCKKKYSHGIPKLLYRR